MQYELCIEYKSPTLLKPYARNPRRHTQAQIQQIAASIRQFGFTNPILISDDNEIIAGHGRVEAAKLLGIEQVPTARLSHLSEADRRAYVLADNKLALNAGWDAELLAAELQGLLDLQVDVTLTGFSLAEIDLALDAARDADPEGEAGAPDALPPLAPVAVTRPGDLWRLGRHLLLCGDARAAGRYETLLGGRAADLLFTDPPYNVRIDGHATGLGRIRHREFAMASGEMSEAAFTAFLTEALGAAAGACRDGAIAYVCMDWRHMRELLAAGGAVFSELKNLCVWNKSNAGMGSFYRSKHELVFVYKVGRGEHLNAFGLGHTGRPRSNVWDYPGVSGLGAGRAEALALHPTVKPVALVADAIRDCSRRGELVLDPFAGSGTTLIAAHTCGRLARVIELDPRYCDVILRRYQQLTGQDATLADDGRSFETVAAERVPAAPSPDGPGEAQTESAENQDGADK
jgi:DNA modification methylase